jgi:hypothetical protein
MNELEFEDSILRSQPFPYKIDITLKNKLREEGRMHGGAGFMESDSILYHLHNSEYDIIESDPVKVKSNEDLEDKSTKLEKYIFEIEKILNKETPKLNSYYISNGFFSTAIGIKCISHSNFDKLVFKLKFIRNRLYNHDEKIKEWNLHFYMLYRREKRGFGKTVPSCYFYGNKIIKYQYDPEIVNNGDKPLEYNELFKNKHLSFSIYKYYTQKVDSIHIKKNILLKFSVLLYHFCSRHYYIYDLKYDNIGFDEDYNIVFIDYDELTYTLYKRNENDNYKSVLWKQMRFSFHCSCDFKKRLYSLIKLGSDETKKEIQKRIKENNKIYSDDLITNIDRKNSIAVSELIIEATKGEYRQEYFTPGRFLTHYNLYFEKFNVISIADILFRLFFKEIDLIKLLIDKKIITKYGEFLLNSYDFQMAARVSTVLSTFQNLNDIDLLIRFIYNFIQPIDDLEETYVNNLKFLILDPITETGLLGTDFESVPAYELIAKFIKKINGDDTPIYQQFKEMIDANIGTSKVIKQSESDYESKIKTNYKITNVGDDVLSVLRKLQLLGDDFDTITYNQWQLARLVEILMDRPDNRSDTSLDLPCVNSTLPQNYIITRNTDTGELVTVIKWIKNKQNMYIENPEYVRIKKLIKTGRISVIISPQQTELDKTPLRQFAMIIVNFLKGLDIKSIAIPKILSKEHKDIIELLKTLKLRSIVPIKSSLEQLEKSYVKKLQTPSDGLWMKKSIGSSPTKSDGPWRKKYIKYKNKYIELKNS